MNSDRSSVSHCTGIAVRENIPSSPETPDNYRTGPDRHPYRLVRVNAYYDACESKRRNKDTFVAWCTWGWNPEYDPALYAYGDEIEDSIRAVIEKLDALIDDD